MNPTPPSSSTDPSPPPPPPPPPKKSKHAAPKGPPWSEQETTNLIRAYQDKWYSLKRGLLRSHQWDAVASSVATLCGLDHPSKSGVQCRHKMEKLRKRYRDELQRRPSSSRWPIFHLMDQLERGPLPISSLPPSTSEEDDPADDNDDDDDQEEGGGGGGGGGGGEEEEEEEEVVLVGRRVRCRREEMEEMAAEEEIGCGGHWREEAAEIIMRYEEGCLRIEKKRMEIIREFERDLMELESKRAEMAFDSRRRLAEVVDRSLRSSSNSKKLKRQHHLSTPGASLH